MSRSISPNDPILAWEPKTWRDALDVAQRLDGWLFRGHAVANWALTSTLERVPFRSESEGPTLHDLEEESLNAFKRQAHQFLLNAPDDTDNIEWLALLQHHGGPTRLLDCTRSFHVAAFHALENVRISTGRDTGDVQVDDSGSRSQNQSAIWAFDQQFIDEVLCRFLNSEEEAAHPPSVRRFAYRVACDSIQPTPSVHGCPDDPSMSTRHETPLVALRPWQLNQRVTSQQGWFLFPTSVDNSLERALCTLLELPEAYDLRTDPKKFSKSEVVRQLRGRRTPPRIIKIILSHDLREEILRDLSRLHFTAATLFPGLDGLARSMQMSALKLNPRR